MRILLAISLLFVFSFQSVKAESVWLVLSIDSGSRAALEKIEMKDMEQCEAQGKIYKNSERISTKSVSRRGFECLKGK
tara:strand:- start:36 stop:269 length:234 start_codon:yes stop_codon:yes gene_type:complete